ncbi:Isochorismatase-like protein [Aspergillus cavernicola]|uniref:Isochorismatase-like protein n=1 Tax=Aspergillus cavernicola TaxID=176166 RepID=A0ABR4HHS7_9EURO
MGATVLLLMDLQEGILDRLEAKSEYLERINEARNAARAADVKIIYVTICFRPGHPETSHRNVSFARLEGFVEGDAAIAIPPTIAPLESDIVVTKRRVSAFAGSDLDVVLRSLEAETLVLAGVATSGVVLSTLRQAADLDYRLTVLQDLCMDLDPEIHRVLVDKVFPKQAQVASVDQWVASLGSK